MARVHSVAVGAVAGAAVDVQTNHVVDEDRGRALLPAGCGARRGDCSDRGIQDDSHREPWALAAVWLWRDTRAVTMLPDPHRLGRDDRAVARASVDQQVRACDGDPILLQDDAPIASAAINDTRVQGSAGANLCRSGRLPWWGGARCGHCSMIDAMQRFEPFSIEPHGDCGSKRQLSAACAVSDGTASMILVRWREQSQQIARYRRFSRGVC